MSLPHSTSPFIPYIHTFSPSRDDQEKLTYLCSAPQAAWDPTTPFVDAIGPLGNKSGIRLLALRTCKADVVVGLPPGKDEELQSSEQDQGTPGARKWAWTGQWAVCQFNDGKESSE